MTGILSFNLESKALSLCEQRASLIAKNISNTNTSGYKAQDINFHEAMNKAQSTVAMENTHNKHIQIHNAQQASKLYYRVPMQQSHDENTVDDEIERKNFVENALHYQAGVGFVQNKANQLIKAFRGE